MDPRVRSRGRSPGRSVLIALAALLALALAGCTLQSTPSGTDADGVTTLRFWQYYQGQQKQWLVEQTERFERENPKINIELIDVVGDQQGQKLLAAVSIGNGPDLLINNIVVDFPTLSGAGVMRDITPEWESFADRELFPPETAWRNEGRVYNLLPYTNLLGMYYNADILREVGITEVPTTISELEAAMEQVSADGRYQALAMSGAPDVSGAWLFFPQLLGLDIDYCSFSGPEVDQAFQRIDRWSDRGWLPQATATWSQTDAWQQFSTGRYAFGLNGNWNLGNAGDLTFTYGTAQYPAPDGGVSRVFPGGEGIAIGAQTQFPDLAWKYVESVFLSAEGARTINATAGSIPVRADVAGSDALAGNTEVAPFVRAAQASATWPTNSATADMQRALGEAVSGVYSGQLDAGQGARSAIDGIAAARAEGGGGC